MAAGASVASRRAGGQSLPGARQQRGAGAVTMLLLLGMLVGMLVLVEVGYIYWVKREAQKIADLSALAGAQRLDLCVGGLDNSAAREIATVANRFTGTLQVRCGNWAMGNAAQDHFVVSTDEVLVNAVQVVARQSVVPFFSTSSGLTVSASAVARHAVPTAAFSVGSRLLNVNSEAPLQGLLRLVGADLDATQLLSYNALADVQVTPRGLLSALGVGIDADLTVGEINSLLQAESLSVGQLLDVVTTIASQQQLPLIDITALRSALRQSPLGNLDAVTIRLGSGPDGGGLLSQLTGTTDAANAALDTNLNVLDLVGAAITIASGKHAITLEELGTLGGITAKAAVVEPASLGIGAIGTTAYNAQIRVNLDVDTDKLAVVGSVLKLLGIRVHLPVFVDVVDAFGELTGIDCSGEVPTATIAVTSSISNICVGQPVGDWASTQDMCVSPGSLLNADLATLFGKSVLSTQLQVPSLASHQEVTLPAGEVATVAPNQLAVGTLVSNLVAELLDAVDSLLSPTDSSSATAANLANQYLQATKDSNGRYNINAVVAALQNGYGDLGALGTWNTPIPSCTGSIIPSCKLVNGDVWAGFRYETTNPDTSLLGGLLSALGVTSCTGLLTNLLNYNNCVANSLAKYVATNPAGVKAPTSNAASCTGVLCALLRPVIQGTLEPLLNSVGSVLSSTLANVFGLELGRSDVHVQAVQCRSSQLVY
ncbi:Uncharacterized membrane protein [Pseudoxanthomonas sp. GM95]|uniref:pilus assembly protein TadG-related protein n=1 Tax=Pseudoxanthomonas sp. GM95 TaxID=1881043 RepID=UPI0008ADF6AA|nr:pilus assembly protein TadG-related protein [Pseudoxanthomonas sp. GM95]SEL69228.1 Uncharacterized membrane protein [Pseudoxanthomonas sp. GM95]